MSFSPILAAPLEIQLHAGSALLALMLGPFALFRARRDRLHKVLGYVWVLAMGFVALSSFLIWSFPMIGPFSLIHLLSIFTLWSLYEAMRHVFAGRIREHRAVMTNLYWRGLIIAGLFNFLPGRTTNRMFFPDTPQLGHWVIGLGVAAIIAQAFWSKRSQRAWARA